MKQFNLQEYLANPSRQVVTRDGRKVTRFLCTDAKTDFPIIALIEVTPGSTNESLCAFKKDGKYFEDIISNCDLFFAPTIVKRWGIVYRKAERLFDTREEAEKWMEEADEGEKKFCSVCKVEWEEESV